MSNTKAAGAAAGAAGAAAAAIEVEECMVCCEPYNKRSHTPVECEYAECKYKVCIGCVRAYLMTSTNEAHCMNCNKAWSQDFQINSLKASWINGAYRQHRKQLLLDIEISKLPGTMEAAARMKVHNSERSLLAQLVQEYNIIDKKFRDLENAHPITNVRGLPQLAEINHIIAAEKKLELDPIRQQLAECQRRIHDLEHPYAGDADGTDGSGKKEKRVFMMPCPANECKGMLSTQYKCGICELFACPECHEMIGKTKNAEHTCDPNNVASAQAIQKETKQCPGCPNRIYRIEGCSQMWCTGCHTAFDWNTGRVVKSQQLHNPHWQDYQRNQSNGEALMRAPGDIPCGGLINHQGLRLAVNKVFKVQKTLMNNLLKAYLEDPRPENIENHVTCTVIVTFLPIIHQLVDGITRNDIRSIREKLQHELDFQHERCLYILNLTTKEELAALVYKKNVERSKITRILHVYELFSAVGIDTFNEIHNSELTGVEFIKYTLEKMIEYNALRVHCNGLFDQISHAYSVSAPFLNDVWTKSGLLRRCKKDVIKSFNKKADNTIMVFSGGVGVWIKNWLEKKRITILEDIVKQREDQITKAIADAENAAREAKKAENEIRIATQKAKEAAEHANRMKIKAEQAKGAHEKGKTFIEKMKDDIEKMKALVFPGEIGSSATQPIVVE